LRPPRGGGVIRRFYAVPIVVMLGTYAQSHRRPLYFGTEADPRLAYYRRRASLAPWLAIVVIATGVMLAGYLR
jgi:hypothetical protein